MGKRVLKNSYVALIATGGTLVDRSTWVRSMSLTATAGDVVVSTFGITAVAREGGLLDNTLTLEIVNTDDGAVDAELFPLVGQKIDFEVRATNSSVSSTNPKFTGTAVLTSYDPLSGAVGEASTSTVNLPLDGVLTRATS